MKSNYILFIIAIILGCSQEKGNDKKQVTEPQQQDVSYPSQELIESEVIEFTESFLNLCKKYPLPNEELSTFISPGFSRVVFPKIEDFEILKFQENTLTVKVKPRPGIFEEDSDWTRELQFKYAYNNDQLYILPSVRNSIKRAYWESELISENNNSRVDYSEKWFRENLPDSSYQFQSIIEEVDEIDIGVIWNMENPTIRDGVFGKNYNRIRIKIVDVKKSGSRYSVEGNSILNGKEVSFYGSIEPTIAYEYLEQNFDPPLITIISNYVFREEQGGGEFKGTLVSYCKRNGSFIELDKAMDISAFYHNNTFVGTWSGDSNYKCIWGDDRLPYTGDFDVGTSEKYVNEKYQRYGWDYNDNLSVYDEYVPDELKTYLTQKFPDWSFPSPSRWDSFWFKEYKTDSSLVSFTKGDFNCDKITDYVFFLNHNTKAELASIVLHGKENGSFEVALEEVMSPVPKTKLLGTGIYSGNPGVYSYVDPDADESPSIIIDCQTITWISFEKAAQTYYWKDGKYEMIQTGD